MPYVSVARREALAKKGLMACPKTFGYPLDTCKRVKNAMARYSQKATEKCKGGRTRICKRYKACNLTHTDAYQKYC